MEQAGPYAPPHPPMGEVVAAAHIQSYKLAEEKQNRFLVRGGEIRQRAWGSPEGRHGPLYSSHESFPFGPNEDLAVSRGTAGSAMSFYSLASVFSVLWSGV